MFFHQQQVLGQVSFFRLPVLQLWPYLKHQPEGVFIKNESGDVIGAIGVSGSSVEIDHDVASAGADAVK